MENIRYVLNEKVDECIFLPTDEIDEATENSLWRETWDYLCVEVGEKFKENINDNIRDTLEKKLWLTETETQETAWKER